MASKPSCWLAQFSTLPCDGKLRKCHLIAKQTIKRETNADPWDPRCWVWGCGGAMGLSGHHGALDGCQIRIPRASLPPEVEEFAVAYGLGWYLDRTFGEVIAPAAPV